MARYHHYQRRYKGYSDLRNFLDDKHQRGEEPNLTPCDPPSLLRDPLRGDYQQSNNRLPRNDIYRGRGRFQRRPNYNQNYTRPRGYHNPRGHSTSRGHHSRLPINPTNIKIEFSTESGERKCQIEPENDISNKFNAGDRGRGGYNYRNRHGGYRRGRGNYGSYYRRSKIDPKNNPENSPPQNTQEEVDNVKGDDEKWDNPELVEELNQKELDLSENVENNLDDGLYVEGEYLDEDEYYEGDEGQEEEQSGLEEKEKINDAELEEKVDEKKLSLESESNKNEDGVKTDLVDTKVSKESHNSSQHDTKDSKDELKDTKDDPKSPEVSENKTELKSDKN